MRDRRGHRQRESGHPGENSDADLHRTPPERLLHYAALEAPCQRRYFASALSGAAGIVAVIGTPIGPTGMYTTVWFGEFTICFCASIASCWMYIALNCPR